LHGLTDVNVTEGSGIDGKFLQWDNATSKWIAGAMGNAANFNVGPHRYWKMANMLPHQNNDNVIGLVELALYNGATALTVSASKGGALYSNSYPTSNLFDGNTSTLWATANYFASYIWMDLGSPQNVTEIKWTTRTSPYEAQCPMEFEWLYSDDGINFTSVGSVDAATVMGTDYFTPPASSTQYTIPVPTILTGTGAMQLSQMLDTSITSPADGQLLRFNASTSKWENWQPKTRNNRPLASTFSTTFHSLGGTLTDQPNGPVPGLALVTPATTGTDAEQRLTAVPGSLPYSIFTKYKMLNFNPGGVNISGPTIYNSGNNLSIILTFDNALNQIYVHRLGSGGAYASIAKGPTQINITDFYIRIDVGATNVTWWLSPDGYTWVQYWQETVASYIGAVTHAGYGSGANSAFSNIVLVEHWHVDASSSSPGFLA
jgi:hypothetical protein